jgi:hypothetical protein
MGAKHPRSNNNYALCPWSIAQPTLVLRLLLYASMKICDRRTGYHTISIYIYLSSNSSPLPYSFRARTINPTTKHYHNTPQWLERSHYSVSFPKVHHPSTPFSLWVNCPSVPSMSLQLLQSHPLVPPPQEEQRALVFSQDQQPSPYLSASSPPHHLPLQILQLGVSRTQ